MVKIRLMRVGKRKQPSYRVVVADSRSPRDGRIIEAIGHYQPRQDPSVVEIDNERALYWLRTGAQASDSVRQLLRISGAWSEFSGEAPLTGGPPPAKIKKATPAASVTETEEVAEAEAPAAEAETPAPEAEAKPEAVAEAPAEVPAAEEEAGEEPTS
ncbi:MAG: small subunit ribosomal protein [Actinomycetota bacterium]|jgi:small subunit ribosomal protein S16|nr:small subunit ribosomal protein [Actinomycetota bacterium]